MHFSTFARTTRRSSSESVNKLVDSNSHVYELVRHLSIVFAVYRCAGLIRLFALVPNGSGF